MSIFGNTGSGGSSIFGTANSNQQQQQQQQQQPAASGSSIFGASTPASNPSAFGQSNAPSNTGGSLFGQSSNAGGSSLFGNTQQNKPATSTFGSTGTGGLFGQTNPSNASQPAQGGSSFFATPPAGQQAQQTQQPKTSLFANSTNPLLPASATGGSLFGSGSNISSNNPTGAGTGSTPSLFGSTSNTNPPSGSLFGSTNTASANPAPTIGGPFSGYTPGSNTSTDTTKSGSNTGSLFGSTSGSLFGSTASNTAFSSPLGASTLSTSTFGKPAQSQFGTGSLLRSTTAGSSQQNPQDAQVQFERLSQKIETIANSWDPNSPQCRFQHYFYNLVDPQQVHLYGRPPNATNEVLWQKAIQENPDPSCLVPVIANGFDELRQRIDAQANQSNAHVENIKALQQKLNDLATNHSTTIIPRLVRFSQSQVQIAQRIAKLVQHLHLLIPAVRSSAIRPEEEQLAAELEMIDEEMRGNRNKMKAKLDELWAVFGAMKAREVGMRDRRSNGEWKVVDEEGLARIAQILAEQQAGLAHLTKILHKDLKDLDIILGTGPTITAGDDAMAPDNLWTSTSTLRASVMR